MNTTDIVDTVDIKYVYTLDSVDNLDVVDLELLYIYYRWQIS